MNEMDAHDHRINSVLAHRAHQSGYAGESVTTKTPLSELLTSELVDTEQDMRASVETFLRFIDFCGQDGPHPAAVLKNFYAVVHAIRPQALGQAFGKMTCADYAMLFGETRAAHSWRVKKIFSRFVKSRNAAAGKAGFQKSATATRTFARIRKGKTKTKNTGELAA